MRDPYNNKFVNEFCSYLTTCLDDPMLIDTALEMLENSLAELINKNEINTALSIENFLLLRWAQKKETEEAYNKIYTVINKAYSKFDSAFLEENKYHSNVKNKKIIFIIHTGFFLAHVNIIYSLLSSRYASSKTCGSQIYLVVLDGSNDKFNRQWEKIGVEIVPLNLKLSYFERLKSLALNIAEREIDQAVWMCSPLYLPLFSRLFERVVWWSVKMHPSMPYVARRIGHQRDGQREYNIFGYQWHGFVSPEKFNNIGVETEKLPRDKIKIAAFCRSEIIDNLGYWELVSEALGADSRVEFHYTGRTDIHQKWVERLGIDGIRVKNIGWLNNPAEKMMEYHALLDGFPFGHGVMAAEAICARVPIIFSWASQASNTPFRIFLQNQAEHSGSSKGRHLLGYRDLHQLRLVMMQLVRGDEVVERSTEAALAIFEARHVDDWNYFKSLIFNDDIHSVDLRAPRHTLVA